MSNLRELIQQLADDGIIGHFPTCVWYMRNNKHNCSCGARKHNNKVRKSAKEVFEMIERLVVKIEGKGTA